MSDEEGKENAAPDAGTDEGRPISNRLLGGLARVLERALRTGEPAVMTPEESREFHAEIAERTKGQLEAIRRLRREAEVEARNTIVD